MEEKELSSGKGANVERIAYDEALRKYATGRFMVFQFSELTYDSSAQAIDSSTGWMTYVFLGKWDWHTPLLLRSKINKTFYNNRIFPELLNLFLLAKLFFYVDIAR